MSEIPTQTSLQDLNVIVSGQGGDGSLTVVSLLSDVLRNSGLNVYTERDVLSRIKGGSTSATLRAFVGEHYSISSHIDLLVAFDQEAVHKKAHHLDETSMVIFDNSGGPLPTDLLPEGARTFNAPFSRHAVREFRRDLFKNSIVFAVAGRLLGLADEAMREAFVKRFTRMGESVLQYNLDALALGFEIADDLNLGTGAGEYQIEEKPRNGDLLITGNEAVAFGFLIAGGRFYAGYPITPSTDIMEWLDKWLPQFGGVVQQAEDELAAINIAIGAAMTGTRTMVATCGPGLSLMQEGIGQLGMAEIPLVIVDAQRGGPSTGLPTKPEQSDINLMVFGGHGDFPRIVLSPGHPEDCFYLTIEACNLAQKYQCPVFIAMDQGISQNTATLAQVDLDRVMVDQGKRLSADDLAKLDVFKRYALSEDGVSPYSVPGTPGGMSLVTGNEHNEFGHVIADRINRKHMMDKRQQKMESMLPDLPVARHNGDPQAELGIIGVGMTYGVILDAMERLEAQDVHTQFHQPCTIWPVLEETLAFIEKCQHVFVVEHNATAQLANLLVRQGAQRDKLVSILKYDGNPFRPGELVHEVSSNQGKVNAP
jgi:2-oxoglutarate ferredoxin oxidoreductase subunit alpha